MQENASIKPRAQFSAVILLANLMDKDGTLNGETRGRADRACQVITEGLSDKIIAMGWHYRKDTQLCISEAMKTYIEKTYSSHHIKVLCDRLSRDTVGDAIFSRICFSEAIAGGPLCVVTSDYHAQRTQKIFEYVYADRLDIEVIGAPTNHHPSDKHAAEAKSIAAFEQTFTGIRPGDIQMIYKRLLDDHPFYNGRLLSKFQMPEDMKISLD